jgi:hypothetical protein
VAPTARRDWAIAPQESACGSKGNLKHWASLHAAKVVDQSRSVASHLEAVLWTVLCGTLPQVSPRASISTSRRRHRTCVHCWTRSRPSCKANSPAPMHTDDEAATEATLDHSARQRAAAFETTAAESSTVNTKRSKRNQQQRHARGQAPPVEPVLPATTSRVGLVGWRQSQHAVISVELPLVLW